MLLTPEEHAQLTGRARRARSARALPLRSKIVLACAQGLDNKTVADRLGCEAHTVSKWRLRFVEHRLDRLGDEQPPGRPRTIGVDQVEDVIVATLESTPPNSTHWTRSKMAERTRLSKTTIGKIWKDFELKPHLVAHFKLSIDPLFIDKLCDVVGLYRNPPEAAMVLCVDEKSQVQPLQRSQPAFPMMPGMPERRTHDYVRHGTTTLFAAMNVAYGTVIDQPAPATPRGDPDYWYDDRGLTPERALSHARGLPFHFDGWSLAADLDEAQPLVQPTRGVVGEHVQDEPKPLLSGLLLKVSNDFGSKAASVQSRIEFDSAQP